MHHGLITLGLGLLLGITGCSTASEPAAEGEDERTEGEGEGAEGEDEGAEGEGEAAEGEGEGVEGEGEPEARVPDPARLWCAAWWPLATSAAVEEPSEPLYARVWAVGQTPSVAGVSGLTVEIGWGPGDHHPGSEAWQWTRATHNPDCGTCGNDDEYAAQARPTAPGSLRWAARVLEEGFAPLYCDRGDAGRLGSNDGYAAADAPLLTVPGGTDLKIVSLNLRCLLDDWEVRKELILDELLARTPDLVGFQEACAGGGGDNVHELLTGLQERTGLPYTAVWASTHRSRDTYQEGLALRTPHPITSWQADALPAGAFPRKLLRARRHPRGRGPLRHHPPRPRQPRDPGGPGDRGAAPAPGGRGHGPGPADRAHGRLQRGAGR